MEKFQSDVEAANALNQAYQNIHAEISKVIIGQDEVVKLLLTSIFYHFFVFGAKFQSDSIHP
jgi:MoxR-like ATPase